MTTDARTISKETAIEIAMSYREIEQAQALLDEVQEALERHQQPDIRDAFGRNHGGLQLGVPTGDSGRRLYNVPWNLCAPILRAHAAHHRSRIEALTETARAEITP